jgi:hypothetical protein
MQDIDRTDDDGEFRSMQDRLIDTMTIRQQDALDSVEIAGQAMVAGVELARCEFVDYLTRRIRIDLDNRGALLRCRSFEEFRELQGRYLRDAIEQFGDETARLVRLGTELATRSIDRARI